MIKAPISLQDLRRRIYVKAKTESSWRFWGLYVHICKMETLCEAYEMAKKNHGAPGMDGVTFEAIEEGGVEKFLQQIQDELVTNTYAFARTSTRTSARKIHYYKCIGSDGWRKLGGPVCNNGRFIRQDLLDPIVWDEVVRLLEDPTLIEQELDRRLEAARSSNPTKKREQSLQRELAQVGKGIERLLSAYQEALVSIEQLRERMPALRQREQTLRAELQAITDQANDRATFLRLAETLTAFLARLRGAADTLSISERQRIVRLVVKDVLIGEDTITIRHSIPVQQGPQQDGCIPPSQTGNSNYLLCKGRDFAAAQQPLSQRGRPDAREGDCHHPLWTIHTCSICAFCRRHGAID
jgi:hypothetical protein